MWHILDKIALHPDLLSHAHSSSPLLADEEALRSSKEEKYIKIKGSIIWEEIINIPTLEERRERGDLIPVYGVLKVKRGSRIFICMRLKLYKRP